MFYHIIGLMGVAFVFVFILMSLVWLHQYKNKNAGLVDVAWGISFPVSAAVYYFFTNVDTLRKDILLVMIVLWGFRLAIYLFKRNWNKPEDARYLKLREEWGDQANLKLFFFFQFQALLSVLLSFPFLLCFLNPSAEFSAFEIIGIILWAGGLLGEHIADQQLSNFKANPLNKNKICDVGLWKYSRHPNYFFEWLIWVAYFIFSLSSEYGWLSFVCPALMLHFLMNVTGIKYTEEHMLASRGEVFIKYQESTSAFFPWFKK